MSDLAERIRAILGDDPNTGEVRMFGGTCFTLNGNMLVVARGKGGLLVRLGEAGATKMLDRPGVERMVMRGREMNDYVTISQEGLDDHALRNWITIATAYVAKLPAKAAKKSPSGKRAKTAD